MLKDLSTVTPKKVNKKARKQAVNSEMNIPEPVAEGGAGQAVAAPSKPATKRKRKEAANAKSVGVS